MTQQHWYHFDFALVTMLADCLGKARKFAKCRELFDDIINQGRVPNESTFHILIVTYLSAPVDGCLDDACSIYNRMIQSGGYRPRLSLHNSLFRALVSKPGGASKHHLNQAEFIYHNIVTSDLEVHRDVYAGLIWLHSYQDVVDRERIAALREEMRNAGFYESRDVLISIMRAFSKVGDLEETERVWLKLLESGGDLPSQAFVYRMELHAKLGKPMKSLEIFKSMKNQMPTTVAACHKIIEVMSKAREVDIAEKLLDEFVESGMKPLMPAFIDVIYMYFNLGMHDKLEVAVSKCLTRCHPNRTFYNIYLESLVMTGSLEKAEEIFNEMYSNGTIGATARSCNAILGGYLASNVYDKAEKVYDIMRQKKYDVDLQFREKLQHMFSLKRKVVKRRVSMKLDQEQREILIGLLLGGVIQIESDEERRNHAIRFEFSESSEIHCRLKMHIHERFYQWLTYSSRSVDEEREVPSRFSTISHSYFGFFADQFWMKGRLMIPKLIHRWLSPRVLAYWYMLGGFRISSSGDILLKVKSGNREDIERVVKALRAKSLACKVKGKGRMFWIGLQGGEAVAFWGMVEPCVLENVRDHLAPCCTGTRGGERQEGKNHDSDDTESDSDGQRLNEEDDA